jgi:hypothetical protein
MQNLFRHPKYNPNNLAYDVALFLLDKPVDNVKFAKLATKAVVGGWLGARAGRQGTTSGVRWHSLDRIPAGC